MNIEYNNANNYHRGDSVTFIIWGDPNIGRKVYDAEMRWRQRSEYDPERPPRREPGDKYIIIGTIVGMIVGGALGAIIGNHYLGTIVSFFCAAGGFIVGGIIGATAGNLIKKRRQKILDKKYSDPLRYRE